MSSLRLTRILTNAALATIFATVGACGGGTTATAATSSPAASSPVGGASGAATSQPGVALSQALASYGADSNGNGVPDVAERVVDAAKLPDEQRRAALHFLRLNLQLAAQAQVGLEISDAMKANVLDASACHSLIKSEGGVSFQPEDALKETPVLYSAMYRSIDAVGSFQHEVSMDRVETCAKAGL